MPTIRTADQTDASRLAELAERTFRDTFEAMNTPEDMALHCAAHYGEAVQSRELADPGTAILVSEHEGRLIGFAQLRWDPPPACVRAERPAELQRLYVRRDWHGEKVAQGLMAAALDLAAAGGADQIWLGVWENNPRAIAFYRKWGFLEVGEHTFPLGTDLQRDLVMTRPIRSGP